MLNTGDFIGPYEIHGFVGQGGMGEVYRAFDPRLERTIALKVILIPEEERAAARASGGRALVGEFSTRMLREARAVASLSHPNVVAIYDVGESEGRLFLAMEYVVGSSLRNLVGNAELPLARRVRWLVDVARALDAAHKAGIVHRDVKPENVMIREDGVVKVLDFGIARRTVGQTADDQHSIDTVTGGGAIAGTPVYMAPEQIRGGEIDARCDQFGWAVLAYELITGVRPWAETGDLLSHIARVLMEPPRSIRTTAKNVPSVIEETVMRALAKDPAQRFPSMSDIAEALEPFATQTTGADRVRVSPRPLPEDPAAYAATTRVPTTIALDAPAHETIRQPAPRRRRRLPTFALPLLLLGALGAGAYVLKTRGASTTRSGPAPQGSAQRPLSPVPQAERAYLDAMRLWRDGATAKARAALVKAVTLDPTFSVAHLELALQHASENDAPAAQASFQSAYEHRHMLLPRDEELLEASEPFVRLSPDIEEWETRMAAAVFQYPRDPELQYYLGRAKQRQGDHEGAKAAFELSIRLDEGFIPALDALAQTKRNLGSIADGLAMTDRCVKQSPVAAVCVQTRYELLFDAGECTRAKEEATLWGSLEPQSPKPFASLARALHASGAPRPSVEEVLSRGWSLVPPDERKVAELWDRALLAILDGDLARADDLAREYDAVLPHTADSYDHASPARVRVNVLMELDRMKDAAKAARTFLDRMAAWHAYGFAPEPSIAFYEPLYRAGELSTSELEAKRADWLERERRRTSEHRTADDVWTPWATVYGSFAESRDEAIDGLAQVPPDVPVGDEPGLFVDFALGKVYALAGRWDDARPHLERVVSSCATFESTMLIAKARLYLGQAHEAKGEIDAAEAAYQKVLATWPKTATTRTTRQAAERLATLRRR
ncbi:MAG TPA: protein kinase [Labilithrix sp.]|nr:protein kinase [Labilithrix sp.]